MWQVRGVTMKNSELRDDSHNQLWLKCLTFANFTKKLEMSTHFNGLCRVLEEDHTSEKFEVDNKLAYYKYSSVHPYGESQNSNHLFEGQVGSIYQNLELNILGSNTSTSTNSLLQIDCHRQTKHFVQKYSMKHCL